MSDSLHGSLATEYRRQLLLLNRERIEFAYVKAQANALDDPVILVLDLQDDSAVRLAQLTGLPWEQIEQCERPDVVPTQVVAVQGILRSRVRLPAPSTPHHSSGDWLRHHRQSSLVPRWGHRPGGHDRRSRLRCLGRAS